MASRSRSTAYWIGCLFVLAAAVLILIATISAPTVPSIAIFGVQLANSTIINFGSFGYCYIGLNQGGVRCSPPSAGYDVVNPLTMSTGMDFSASSNVDNLTRGMILHPIACGLTLVSFLVAITSKTKQVVASSNDLGLAPADIMVLLLAWIFTTVVTALDFSSINQLIPVISLNDSLTPIYGSAIWCMMIAFIIQLLAAIIFGGDYYVMRKRVKSLQNEQRNLR